jgi:hypothetical protein
MGDLLFVAVVVAFFALAVAYVKGCERIVGPDTPLPDDGADAAASAEAGRPAGSAV